MTDETDIELSWNNVIDRRVQEVIADKSELVDGAEGLARIRDEIAARRA